MPEHLAKLIKIQTYSLREYTFDKHRRVDGKPYGGGPGMVMWVEPIVNCVEKIKKQIKKKNLKSKIKTVLFTPGKVEFTNIIAKGTAKKYTDIIFVCGRYEGVDARVVDILKADQWSVGPYVLTGGELPAMVCVDAISRQISGVLNDEESIEENRISSHNVYGRPEVYEYKKTSVKKDGTKKTIIKKYSVPKVLLSGNHKLIENWKNNTNIK